VGARIGALDALHLDLPGVLVQLHFAAHVREVAGFDLGIDDIGAMPEHGVDLAAAIGELKQQVARAIRLLAPHLLLHHQDGVGSHPRQHLGDATPIRPRFTHALPPHLTHAVRA
jgi:hypothetical protein